jgi:glyoxylase-like metal-dependent hydrolase (beta-lactamase superfamily II)
MEVQPGIHLINDKIDATTLAVTLVGGERALIVDTGLPTTPERAIYPYLQNLGLSPGWIETIVNTHCHLDHAGGNGSLLAANPNARLLIHASEMPYLASPLTFVTMLQERYADGRRQPPPNPETVHRQYGPGSQADASLEDGDYVVVDNRSWRVIHAPGHSAGGICLYEEASGTLITGDAIQAEGTTSCDLPFYFEAIEYGRSVRRVSEIDVATIIAGHPFKPFPSSVLVGSEARRFLAVSLTAFERLRDQVVTILRQAATLLSTAEIAETLTRLNGFDRCVGPAVQTSRAHLEELRAECVAERVYVSGAWHWRLKR